MLHHGDYAALHDDNASDNDNTIELDDIEDVEAVDDVQVDAGDNDDDDASDGEEPSPPPSPSPSPPPPFSSPEADRFALRLMQNMHDLSSLGIWLSVMGLAIYSLCLANSVGNVENTTHVAGWRFCRDSNQYCKTMDIVGPCVCAKYCPFVSVAVRNTTAGAFHNCAAFFENPKYCDILYSYSECLRVRSAYIDNACKLSKERDWKRQKAPILIIGGFFGLLLSVLKVSALCGDRIRHCRWW